LLISISPRSPTRSRRRRPCWPNSASPRAPSSRSTQCTAKKRHFEAAADANVTLIVGVKDNQPTLHQQVEEVSATTTPLGCARSHDKGRNRDERRTVTVFDPANKLADTDWHPHVAAIIRVERNVYTRNAKTGLLRHSTETAFYVSNTPVTAPRAAQAIRAHWTIENTSHYSRDVTLGEDRSRIRTNPGVFARLRSFAFNILKANQTDTLSQDRYRAGLAGIKNLLSLTAIRKR
jgi:predicted transposase YbfD/YdcC